MFKFASILLAAGLLGTPLLAATPQKLEFQRDGVHYVGAVTDLGDGAHRITGHEVESGREFALDVAKGRVTGRYDGQLVSYAAPANSSVLGAATAAAGND